MKPQVHIYVGGPTREPTPEFEAWWAEECAWHDAQATIPAACEAPRTTPKTRPRAVRTCARRTAKPAGSDDDDPEPPEAHQRGLTRLVAPKTLTLHPKASLVPEQRSDEFRALLADIRAAATITSPLLVRGQTVLDGRHRLRAALELGLAEVPVVEAPDDGRSDEEHILATALHRRHLTDDQRAMLAAEWARARPAHRGDGRARDSAALHFGVSSVRVKKALRLLGGDAELAAAARDGRLRLSQALTRMRYEAQLRRIATSRPPEGCYRTIVIDPPWRYENHFTRGAAEDEYPTMSDADIMGLPVSKLLADDAHVYLWTPGPKLEAAYSVLRAWGLEPVQLLVWVKDRLGLGRHFRQQAEFILFAVRGAAPLRRRDVGSVLHAPARGHSVKPAEFYALVEQVSFEPYLEMFARAPRANWTVWGAEAEGRESAINTSPPDGKREEGGPT